MEDPDAASPQPETPDPDPTSLQEAMQDPVNVWLGPVGPLLRKLHSLTTSGQSLPDGLSADEIHLLRDGLKKLCAPLQDMSEDEVDASVMARWWMKIVRELCYDTEDHLDEVIGAGAHLDFSEFLDRVKDASKRGERFQWWTIKPGDVDRRDAGVSRLTSSELPFPIYGHSCTVGVAEPPKKLVDLLALDDDDKQTLKVISISGCAGVGKTTVARTLYHKHAGKFQCRAFVTVSQNPDTRGFLASMLSQLKAPRPHGFLDVPDLIDAISKHLEGKRYFIVIDDLWLASIWNIISRAFPRGDYCSRIISTTQIDDVALACCSYDSGYIYMMEPLNDHESRKLFFGRVFGSEDGCPTDILEVSDMIIRKCGGLPLAIVDIASLLACESSIVLEKWKHVHDSLPSTSEGMKDFLNLICNSLPHLIYSSLPPRLRTCLLYLSMYPQGCVIKKDELVKLWVAEGFLSVVGGRDTQDIAEGYFAELVSRGIVQVVDTSNNGEVFSCTVHQTVLDYIRHKSMEKNFVITVDYFQSTVALSDKVRRLSVQFGGVKSAYIPETIVTSQVRSLIFWGFFECVPSSIKDYGLLRVLILHIWADEDNESFDLTGIGELFLLKYLKIECNITVELPDKIQGLQHLETLEVYAKVVAAPSDIGNMKRLLHLCLPSEYIQPSVVARMTSLRALRYIDLSRCSVEDVLHLGELTNLQDLQLTGSTVQPAENPERNVQLLGSILEKLSVLQSVTLVPAASGSSCVHIPQDGFSMASPSTRELLLRRIELSWRCCIFFSLPEWFGELRRLCILKIAIRRLSMNDTDMLKGLPALTALTLYIQTAPADRIVIKKEGFKVLTYFKFICAAPCVSFVPGAMPKVQKLKLGFNSNRMKQHSFRMAGLRFLRGLTEFSVKFGVEDDEKFDIKAAESVMEAAIWNPPNTPIMRVRCVDVIFCAEEDKSTATEEIEEKLEGKKKEDIEPHLPIPVTDFLPDQFSDSSMAKINTYKNPSQLDYTKIQTDPMGYPSIGLQKRERSEEKRHEIEESKKKKMKHSVEHANKPLLDSRYATTDRVHVVTGTMGSLLPKLLELLKDEYNLEAKVKASVESLHLKLERLQACLSGLARLEPKRLDEILNGWARAVRDFSYDAEDAVDSLPLRIEGSRRLITWVTGWLSRKKAHKEIADTINGIKKKAWDLSTLYQKCLETAHLNSATSNYPRLFATYANPTELVGIEVPRDEVIWKLTRGTGGVFGQPKIVSIVGMGGLGKTTLAKAVYDKIQVQYDYKAFVPMSRDPDIRKVYMDILLLVDKQSSMGPSLAKLGAGDLQYKVRRLLADKRYIYASTFYTQVHAI
ncbi:disease resistance protein RGA5-like [Aegilops tauschii subsp. strangulata]|nr:disease resistance protein RGA5-like [Aegilops tauschii subsp. strangulata]